MWFQIRPSSASSGPVAVGVCIAPCRPGRKGANGHADVLITDRFTDDRSRVGPRRYESPPSQHRVNTEGTLLDWKSPVRGSAEPVAKTRSATPQASKGRQPAC